VHVEKAAAHIFVEFSSAGVADKARESLHGRTFDGRKVEAHAYSLDTYKSAVRAADLRA
jgi:hypothetical protein